MTSLIKDLIDIPERVQKGDFVLKLVEDIKRPEVVLDNYVVTPELARNFDAALTFIHSALQGRTSKATYLHGSFGSGKSHFMAVLDLILEGNSAARGIPELAPVIQNHNHWLAGKKFLLVPYHMINAHDMESGVLGGYVDFARQARPESPVPPVYMSAAIIAQAQKERTSYGDEPFFRRLNAGQDAGGGGGRGGWGELEAAWDAASFEAAANASPDSEAHLRLVSTLLKTVASSHAEVISHRGGNFVRFDKGLSIIAQHAASLGYDAVILFLDELILWLAMKSADHGFVRREVPKLTNLVEAQSADRPIPLVSFVARQRDLRELVGDHVPGAERLSFGDALDWQGGRFDTITLEDRNLPAIAEKRVLRCKTESARKELDAAFEQTARMKDNVMSILLTREGDRQMFRKVYPFSPALVQTLIAVSSVLQRERTALKVMIQLLVDHRETLKVGDVVPVGDLFDVVAHGDEAFTQDMAIHFDNAKRLYHQKLLPMLETQHGMRREDVEQLAYDDPKRVAFRNDDRLVKTLLLSALVPEVESLRGLNAEKLAALNHGTIKSPVPGREAQLVLQRCRTWAAAVGEIRIGEESNPTITVQLSGVDTESIIEQARREDNQGNRIRRVRQMIFEQLGIEGEGEFEQYQEFLWRNTKRSCVVLFKNVRELPDSSLENTDDSWKLVIDFPFDEAGHGPRDDLSTVQRFMQSHPDGTKTLCWVPSFFSQDAQKDLGMLVILEHILTGERFAQYSNHLSPQDRQAAKSLLENQRSELSTRVKNHLDAAYGLEVLSPGSLDTTHDLDLNEHYVSLSPGFVLRPPVAADLAGAMLHLLSQALEHEFPAAPYFEAEVKSGTLKRVYELVFPATQSPDGRLAVEKTQRPLVRQIANPLLVPLPAAGVWEPGVQRAGSIFGVAGSRLVTAANAGTLSAEVKKRAGAARPACAAYCQRLKHRMTGIGIVPEKTARMKTAVATRALVDSLDAAEPSSVVGILAAAEIVTSEAAMGECRTRAAELDGNLETAGWDIFDAIGKLTDDRQQAAQEILAELREALSSDEHVVGLAPALTSAQARAVRLLTKPVEAPKPPVVTPPTPHQPPTSPPPTPGWKVVDEGAADGLDLSRAKDELAGLERKLQGNRRIQVRISWRIEEKKG